MQTPLSLRALMTRLRKPVEGCPWDLKQTHQTLAEHLKEEAAETLDALSEHVPGDPEKERHLREELGDLMLQVVFHAQLAQERGAWDFHDMEQQAIAKLVRRHPHIFGEAVAEDAQAVLDRWQQIKKQEKAERGQPTTKRLLDGIPHALCPLEEAMEIGRRCEKAGFEWPDLQGVLDKIEEEVKELREECQAATLVPDRMEAELGDLLFTLIQWARKSNLDPDRALRQQMKRFKTRFQHVEDVARAAGGWDTQSLESLETAWQEAKQKSHAPSPLPPR